MKITLRHHSAGVALIIAVIAVLVLSIMAAIFAASMKVEAHLAQKANNDPGLLWLGRSGVELARWGVAQDASLNMPVIALDQIWAGGTGSPAESNSLVIQVPWDHYPVGDGWVSIKFEDLGRYANINTADTAELQKTLEAMNVQDPALSSVVADSIQDWVNPGELPRPAGAKSDYYQGLNPPYNCKDAPMDDISELLLVKGIMDHPELYDPARFGPAIQHKLGFGAAPGQPEQLGFGLKDVFTPYNPGLINVNTADANVLQCNPGVDQTIAESIVAFRAGQGAMGGTSDSGVVWIRDLNQLTGAGVPPAVVAQMGRHTTTHNPTATFKVTVSAHLGNSSRDYYAILFVNGRDVQVVRFYWE